MLDATLWDEPVSPFCSPNVTAQVACERWQLEGYYELRRTIFAEEQGLFDTSDIDEHDGVATPIVALAHLAGMPDEVIGSVRIYPDGASAVAPERGRDEMSGTWFGGRLGVCRRYRSRGVVGTALIFAAVSTAHARGCTRFLATIQLQNVPYFERHHFECVRRVEVCGQPHQLMEADLGVYPPREAHPGQPVDGARVAAELRRSRAA
jgi:putative N-acetyltransferase (TIGR04045 family)